jgi:tRNA threonylcarbamoyl adenosine modification protein YeaZ
VKDSLAQASNRLLRHAIYCGRESGTAEVGYRGAMKSATPSATMNLVVDTATRTPVVSLASAEGKVIAERHWQSRHRHGEELLGRLDEVLSEIGASRGDITGVVVGTGPGSFTGLRIGMATAKGLCFAAGVPLWSVSSLGALALDAAAVEPLADTLVVPAFDARRGEVCAGVFRVEGDRVDAMGAERIMVPAELAAVVAELLREARLSRAVLIGDALESHGVALAGVGEPLARAACTRRIARRRGPDGYSRLHPAERGRGRVPRWQPG